MYQFETMLLAVTVAVLGVIVWLQGREIKQALRLLERQTLLMEFFAAQLDDSPHEQRGQVVLFPRRPNDPAA